MNKIIKTITSFTIVGMFFHTFLISHFLPKLFGLSKSLVTIIVLWKEIAIFFILLVVIYNVIKTRQVLVVTRTTALIVLYFVYALIYVFVADNLSIGFYGLRNEFEYFAMFVIGCNIRYDENDILRLIKYIIYSAIVISIWGIIQPIVFGDKLLIDLGYGDGSRLAYSFYLTGFFFQRSVSTFSSPNELGAFLMVALLIFLPIKYGNYMKLPSIVIGSFIMLVGTCFLYSFSRSAWIGFIIGALYIAYALRYNNLYKIIYVTISIAIAVMFVTGVAEHLVNTITLRDPSAYAHLEAYRSGVNFILENPLGIGIGMVGPKSQVYLKDSFKNIESSYFLVCYELGMLGLIILISIFVSLLRELNITDIVKKNSFCLFYVVGVIASILSMLVQYAFLPSILDLAIPSLVWFMSGTAIYHKYRIDSRHD